MGLVDYSDSETSDVEETTTAPKPAPTKRAFPKVIHRSEPKKIKVDLPTAKPEPTRQDEEERPAKRAKSGGAFSGINSFLPAPKGRVQNGPKPGVSLKTSSEAAFSRAPVASGGNEAYGAASGGDVGMGSGGVEKQEEAEPKIVGKATKFKPLSVANSKKKVVKKPKPTEAATAKGEGGTKRSTLPPAAETAAAKATEQAQEEPAPKPKRSLFSVQAPEDDALLPETGGAYEITATQVAEEEPTPHPPGRNQQSQPNPNSLQSVAADLNLTPAQRRQLFGRNSNKAPTEVNITHFNTDSEYAANEQARQAGEVVEHRAVKAIAPGKHSLQQLVNNARTQQGAMEDKWAEGRREKGEAGGKYGWSK